MSILVESRHYTAASTAFGDGVHDAVNRALFSLSSALGETGAMAGSDPVGTSWAAQYDPAAKATIAAIGQLCTASVQLGAMLERTGFNHGAAESASDPSGAVATPADTTRYVVEPPAPCILSVPDAHGGSTSPPHGWGLLQHAVGYVWPNGHPGRLRAAAAAWTSVADSLDGQVGLVSEALSSILQQRSPEVDDAWGVCNSMGGHLTDTATICRTLAAACHDLADHIDHAHHEIVKEVVSFVEWTAGIEAAGGLFAVFTAGLSEVAAQAAEAARIGETAGKIKTLLTALVAAAETVTETVRTVTTSVAAVAERLDIIISAKLTSVTVAMSRFGPEFAGEAGSYLRLTKAAETEAKLAKVETRAGAAVGGATSNTELASRLQAAKVWPRGRLPWEQGPKSGILTKRGPGGEISNYAEYDKYGRITKRVDLKGASHNNIPTPHTVEFTRDQNPAGAVFARELPVRPATKDEMP